MVAGSSWFDRRGWHDGAGPGNELTELETKRQPAMSTSTYLVDTAGLPWTSGETQGLTFRCQVVLPGDDGGPEALRFRFDPTPSVYAHMHLTSQFQLVLGGLMDMPRGMHLGRLDVHYTDHCVPYGPFAVDDGHDMLVLHPRRGGLIAMADGEARTSINLEGKILIGSPAAIDWSNVESSAVRFKPLISADGGPYVNLMEFPPSSTVTLGAAPFGRYEVLVEGAMGDPDGPLLGPPALRYVAGEEPAAPLLTGPAGASIMLLSFGPDVRLGGLDAYGFGERAEQMLAQAI